MREGVCEGTRGSMYGGMRGTGSWTRAVRLHRSRRPRPCPPLVGTRPAFERSACHAASCGWVWVREQQQQADRGRRRGGVQAEPCGVYVCIATALLEEGWGLRSEAQGLIYIL